MFTAISRITQFETKRKDLAFFSDTPPQMAAPGVYGPVFKIQQASSDRQRMKQ